MKNFNIKCLNSLDNTCDAIIKYKKETKYDVIVYDRLLSSVIFYSLEYNDDNNIHFIFEDVVLSNTFIKLWEALDNIGIKMLIQGCRYDVVMLRHLKNTLFGARLVIGEKFDKNTLIVNIFDDENDLSTLKKIIDKENYYERWLESIKGLPY